MNHPWVAAATEFGLPSPLPTICQINLIEVTINDKIEPYILLTIATPAGVNTSFLDMDTFKTLMDDAASIMRNLTPPNPTTKNTKESMMKIHPATKTDMRNEVRGLQLLKDTLKNNGRKMQ